MAGEAAASGEKALKRSLVKPGSVIAPERTAPPGSDSASRTTTSQSRSASRFAATSPLGPDPTTTASGLIASGRGEGAAGPGVPTGPRGLALGQDLQPVQRLLVAAAHEQV